MPANAASYNPTASNVRFVLNAEMDRDYKKRVQDPGTTALKGTTGGANVCNHKHLANILEHELCFVKKIGTSSTSKQARLPVFSNFAFESTSTPDDMYMFAGVAMTPLAWDAKQGVQGLALERGSLVTIVNNGDDNLNPGDVVVADVDGVVVVPRELVGAVADASQKREDNEEAKRQKFREGVLGLDIYGMREPLAAAGLEYVED